MNKKFDARGRLIFSLFMVACLGLFFILGRNAAWAMSSAPRIDSVSEKNKPSIDFTLPDLEGKMTSLSDYKGKAIFLNFWATWCPPCREEMPSIQRLHEKLGNDQLVILALAESSGSSEQIGKFMQENKYTFKVLNDVKREVAAKYQIVGVPTTFFIDKKGIIVDKFVGSRDWAADWAIEKIKQKLF